MDCDSAWSFDTLSSANFFSSCLIFLVLAPVESSSLCKVVSRSIAGEVPVVLVARMWTAVPVRGRAPEL